VKSLDAREKLLKILISLKDRIASPSDIIAATGLPRYEVLAAFHILEALNIVELVYIRGNYKLYKLSSEGEKLIKVLEKGERCSIEVKSTDGGNNVEILEVEQNNANIAEAVS